MKLAHVTEKISSDKSIVITQEPYHIKASIEAYQSDIRLLANNKEFAYIKNDDFNCSQITSANIFRTSNSEIQIYTTGFRENLQQDRFSFKKELFECLNRVSKAEIILDKKTDTDVIRGVIEIASQKNNVSVYIVDNFQEGQKSIKELLKNFIPTILEEIEYNGVAPFHFIVGDKEKYRLEYDNTDKKALVNFNDPFGATPMQLAFLTLKRNFSIPFCIK